MEEDKGSGVKNGRKNKGVEVRKRKEQQELNAEEKGVKEKRRKERLSKE